jgi:diguanylate cyclase (GGDEF)-like protein
MSAATRSVDRPAFLSPRVLLRAGGALLILAVAAHILHSLVGFAGSSTDGLFAQWVFPGVELVAGAGCLLRVALVREDRVAWFAIGIGVISLGVGGVLWSLMYANDATPPSPSLPDALFLFFYPCSYAGIVLLMRSHLARHRAAVWLDGIGLALAAAAVVTAIVLPPIIEAGTGNTGALITSVALACGDVMLLSLVVAALTISQGRLGASWWLLAGGFVVNSVTDVAYLRLIATGDYVRGTVLDSGWLISATLIAFAAWQRPRPPAEHVDEDRAIFAPLAAAAATLALSAYGIVGVLTPVAAALTVATLLTVMVRLAITLAENRTMLVHSQEEATTDALSGLGNRRLLMPDLERAVESEGATLVLFDLDGFKIYNDSFGHPAGDALLQRLSRRLKEAGDAHGGTVYRMGGDEFCLLLPATGAAAEPAIDAGLEALAETGEGFAIAASHGTVVLPEEASDARAAMRLADQRLYSRKGGRRSSPYGQTKAALLQVMQEADRDLGDHGYGVAALATATARRLGMDAEEVDEVGRAAELHDIGKIAIPADTLRKPAPLTMEEWRLMHEHTLIGERILSAASALAPVGRIVRATHERWDGGGYPDGIVGEDIPLGARVIGVCDAFDAMTGGRPYRGPVDCGAAIEELRRCAGTQFDPRVVGAFISAFSELEQPWRESRRAAIPVAR